MAVRHNIRVHPFVYTGMDVTFNHQALANDTEQRIAETIARERGRLRSFIHRRIADESDADDVLQDVFEEFITAYRLPESIEQAGAWLFRVARNRIIDRFRKKREATLPLIDQQDEDSGGLWLDQLLPDPEANPEAVYARSQVLAAIGDALAELPVEQRDVFIAHELDGQSFADMAAATGLSINTLLSRKRYAVLSLRTRLRALNLDPQSQPSGEHNE